jgi:hypothetical protein
MISLGALAIVIFCSFGRAQERAQIRRTVVAETSLNIITIDPVEAPDYPYVEVRGDADDISTGMRAKGAATLIFQAGSYIFSHSNAITPLLFLDALGAPENYPNFQSTPSGTAPKLKMLSSTGTDANIDCNVVPLGGGHLQVNSENVNTVNNLSVHASGTAYALTGSAAKLNFGTTDPVLVIDKPGTYLLTARCQLQYNGATFASNRTATLALRRTNNTPADLTNGTATALTRVITVVTDTFVDLTWSVLYTTANSDDSVEIYGSVSAVPTAGSLDAIQAAIIAIRVAS